MSAIRSSSVLLLAAGLLALEGCRATAEKINGPWDAGAERSNVRDRGLPLDFGDPDFGAPDFWSPRPDQGQRDARPHSDFMIFPDTGSGDGPALDGPSADGPACVAPNDPCTGPKKLTWSGMTIAESGDTTCAQDDLDFDMETCGEVIYDGTMGPDVFYEITLPAGSYRVSLDAPLFDPALYVLTACDVLTCVAASDEVNIGVPEALYLQVAASTKYIIGVDSYDPAEYGPFQLVIEESTPPPDAGPQPDGPAADAGPQPDGPVGSGKVVITEILMDPAATGDTAGEWFELYNAGSGPVNLNGWRLADAGTNKHTIASDVFIPPGGYVVIGRTTDVSANGGAPVAYGYGGVFDLANGDDEIMLYDAANNLVDEVAYDSSWSRPVGGSISLKSPGLDNSVAANWCEEPAAWSTSAGDKGTPGAKAGCP